MGGNDAIISECFMLFVRVDNIFIMLQLIFPYQKTNDSTKDLIQETTQTLFSIQVLYNLLYISHFFSLTHLK